MLNYDKNKFDRIAEAVEKLAGINPDTPTPSPSGGSGVMTCRIIGDLDSLDGSVYLDKTYREISDFVANGGMVQAVGEISIPDTEYQQTLVLYLDSFAYISTNECYWVQFSGDSDVEFFSSDIDGELGPTPYDPGPGPMSINPINTRFSRLNKVEETEETNDNV